MHHLHRKFVLRKQSKSMDQTPSPKPKLVRRNAAKNFEYTPSASSSTSSSTSVSSSHRTRSLDLPQGSSFRIEGNAGEIGLIFQSLGLSGPEDFEIPKAAWEALKFRSASDVIQRPKWGYLDDGNEPEEPKKQEGHELVDDSLCSFGSNVEMNEVADGAVVEPLDKKQEGHKFVDDSHRSFGSDIKMNEVTNGAAVEPLDKKHGGHKFVDDSLHRFGSNVEMNEVADGAAIRSRKGSDAIGGKGGGIKGDRPPLLTPPPAMSLPVIDNCCSTWDLLKGLAPDGDKAPRLRYRGMCCSSDDEEDCDGENALREGLNGGRVGETFSPSGSCSFTTTNDDDSSSTTTEPVSIISPSTSKVNITHWQKGVLLGKGSFGTVYEGISSEGFFFAVKEVSLVEQGSQGKQSIYQLEQEIELLSQFEHENIVRYLGTDKDDSNLYIFLELVTQGSLASNYQKYQFRDSHVSAYTRQILLGLKYLHDRNVVHRDIKCANILVAANGTVKLADFGLAKATRLNDLKSCRGTAFWMAPEVVNHMNRGYGLAADIWSLGCTVLEMLTGHFPYYPLEFMQALYRIGKGEPPPIPDALSRDALDLIQQCLRVNPNDRPTAAELLEHPFVRRPLHTSSGSDSPMLLGR